MAGLHFCALACLAEAARLAFLRLGLLDRASLEHRLLHHKDMILILERVLLPEARDHFGGVSLVVEGSLVCGLR